MAGYLSAKIHAWSLKRKAGILPIDPKTQGAFNPGPTPTCTPERMAPFYDALCQHASQAQAAFVIGVQPSTICRWKHKYPHIAQEIEQAIKERGPYLPKVWLNNYALTHPNGPFPTIHHPKPNDAKNGYHTIRQLHRVEVRTADQERQAQTLERQRRRAVELDQRKQTLKKWTTQNPSVLPQLKAMWAKRDADSQILPRLKEYVCEICNRPFATIRKIRVTSNVRCPPCAKHVRAQQLRESYYRNWPQRRAQQNAHAAEQVRTKRISLENQVTTPASPVRTRNGPTPVVWSAEPEPETEPKAESVTVE